FIVYFFVFKSNIKNEYTLYISTGSTFNDVLNKLERNKVLKNPKTFIELAKKVGYAEKVKPGRYIIHKRYSNLELLRKLRNGNQDAVKIVLNNIATLDQLIDLLSNKLEPNKKLFYQAFTDKHLLDSLGLNEENVLTLFIANTYEFYWNISAEAFTYKMLKEYNKFWNDNRLGSAENLGLSPTEITILASIIQKESTKYDEYGRIAGVYYNRLQKKMKLQADPTVLYAKQRLGKANRVYNKDTKIAHPYNTYFIEGLPPGPICMPEMKSIDLCLDLERHDYIYFCAKEDFSGYHSFAKDWETHKINAKKFHDAMNVKNIR
ncbi:MAG: endolytic transglycosylase MltG, partial [Bacteroidetes bacterium]|nr:endolytic transglycosylase MltG [Bacteroidota bacterium]